MKQVCIFFLCLWFISIPGQTEAWWIKTHGNFPVPYDDEVQEFNSLHPCFVMLDNPMYCCTKAENSSLLFWDTKNFASIIRIDARIPLKILSRKNISPGATLNALLYADLQMQQLMEELLRLKKKTNILLNKTSISYLKKESYFKKIPLRNPSRAQKLKDEYETLKRKKTSIRISGFQHLKSNISALTNGEISKRFHPIQQDISRVERDTLSMDNTCEIPVSNINESDELPWLFRAIIAIFHYAIDNRFEFAFYITILFIFFYFVSLKIKSIK